MLKTQSSGGFIMSKFVNIAIDGPAGAGKSSVAKEVAKKLGYIYVDTGALYRAVAYYMLKQGVNVSKADMVIPQLDAVVPELKHVNGEQRVFVNGEDITSGLRTQEISMAASTVSAIPEVRTFLLDLQRRIAAENNVIMDGRDIGTVILPNADVKIFLTASVEERASRRVKELTGKGEKVIYDDVLADMKTRDYNDTHRDVAPLKQAEGAILCDTTGMTLQGVFDTVEEIIKQELAIK